MDAFQTLVPMKLGNARVIFPIDAGLYQSVKDNKTILIYYTHFDCNVFIWIAILDLFLTIFVEFLDF
jgi:hypothetical protein